MVGETVARNALVRDAVAGDTVVGELSSSSLSFFLFFVSLSSSSSFLHSFISSVPSFSAKSGSKKIFLKEKNVQHHELLKVLPLTSDNNKL